MLELSHIVLEMDKILTNGSLGSLVNWLTDELNTAIRAGSGEEYRMFYDMTVAWDTGKSFYLRQEQSSDGLWTYFIKTQTTPDGNLIELRTM